MGDSRRRSRRFTADARYLVFPRARDHAGDRSDDGRDRLRVATGAGTWFSVHGAALAAPGRIVQIGWAHCCNYDHEFCQMASFPLQLGLRTTAAGVRLYAQFIRELRRLRLAGSERADVTVGAGASFAAGDSSGPLEILLEAAATPGATLVVSGSELDLTWHVASGNLRLQGKPVPVPARGADNRISLHLLLDTPSVEAVVNDGVLGMAADSAIHKGSCGRLRMNSIRRWMASSTKPPK